MPLELELVCLAGDERELPVREVFEVDDADAACAAAFASRLKRKARMMSQPARARKGMLRMIELPKENPMNNAAKPTRALLPTKVATASRAASTSPTANATIGDC